MAAGLAGLWVRRFAVARVRFISTPSDHLMLALLLAIAAVGAGDEVRRAHRHRRGEGILPRARALPTGSRCPPTRPLYVHLALVALLLLIFPFSKLLHAPGVFFSPTRNQVDDPREARHLSAWAARLETARTDHGR